MYRKFFFSVVENDDGNVSRVILVDDSSSNVDMVDARQTRARSYASVRVAWKLDLYVRLY